MALARLDHVIYAVPDIDAAHRELTSRLPEAWPVGHFWPDGRTSGIAMGGHNLELMQIEGSSTAAPVGKMLAFEPATFDGAEAALARAGIRANPFEKMESDPGLLRLRGFSDEAALLPQLICRNLIPENPDDLPFNFFVCDYSPFLRGWLSPSNPRLKTDQQVSAIIYGTSEPQAAVELLNELGYAGRVAINFVEHADRRILRIETALGEFDWPP